MPFNLSRKSVKASHFKAAVTVNDDCFRGRVAVTTSRQSFSRQGTCFLIIQIQCSLAIIQSMHSTFLCRECILSYSVIKIALKRCSNQWLMVYANAQSTDVTVAAYAGSALMMDESQEAGGQTKARERDGWVTWGGAVSVRKRCLPFGQSNNVESLARDPDNRRERSAASSAVRHRGSRIWNKEAF